MSDPAPTLDPAVRDSPPALPALEPGEWRLLPTYEDDDATAACPNCGAPMHAIRGSKRAICGNCGFKDSCCF